MFEKIKIEDIDLSKLKEGEYFVVKDLPGMDKKDTSWFNGIKFDSPFIKYVLIEKFFCWAVTGTFHGSIIEAKTEGEARRIFHKYYNGESITNVKKKNFAASDFY